MNECGYSREALISAEEQGLLTSWGFEQETYSVVKEEYDSAVMQKVKSVLSPCDARSISTACALVTALAEGEKPIEQLAYELGFGSGISLFRPYIHMALESGLVERVDSTNENEEYWKLA